MIVRVAYVCALFILILYVGKLPEPSRLPTTYMPDRIDFVFPRFSTETTEWLRIKSLLLSLENREHYAALYRPRLEYL